MPTTFRTVIDHQVFSVQSPIAPEKEFSRHSPVASMNDDALFRQSDAATILCIHWTFGSGLPNRVAGILELQTFLRNVGDGDATSSRGLEQGVRIYLERELSRLRRPASFFPIEKVQVNGREWLKYQVPALGALEYSTVLSKNRFLTVQFSLIDNSAEKNLEWQREANDLVTQLVSSLKLETT
jgi:hypothetical protein